jgi:potassium voltage-gated channel Shal-related subfamily D member 2
MSLPSDTIPLTRLNFVYNHVPPQDADVNISNININGSAVDLTVHGPPWKRALHAILEQPASSPAAFLMHVFSTSLIIISALVTVLETVPAFHSISTRVWFGFETSLVALFTAEYIARYIAWSGSWSSLLGWLTCKSSPCGFRLETYMFCSFLRNHRLISNFTVLH